jgi:hypothetical protein
MGGWRAQWRGGTFGDEPLDRALQDEETWHRQALEDRELKSQVISDQDPLLPREYIGQRGFRSRRTRAIVDTTESFLEPLNPVNSGQTRGGPNFCLLTSQISVMPRVNPID